MGGPAEIVSVTSTLTNGMTNLGPSHWDQRWHWDDGCGKHRQSQQNLLHWDQLGPR